MNYNLSTIREDCKNLFEREVPHLEKLRNRSVLITGANGLIGGFLSDFLCFLNDEHHYNIDIQLTSLSQKEYAMRIKHLISRHDVSYFSWDLAKEIPTDFLKPVDYVFFASGYGQPKKFITNRINTILINTIGLNSLLKLCSKANASLLYMSSSEIYGIPDINNIPTKESFNGNYAIESNRACYISSKRLGEVLCLGYAQENANFNVKIARIALTYGPGVLFNDDRVLQDFIMKGYRQREINLLDDGAAIRNYIYITDCVEAMLQLFFDGEESIYNVGGDKEETTIFEIAKIVGSILDVPVMKGNKKTVITADAPNKVALDMTRYKEEFGPPKATVELRDGIKNVIRWYGMNEISEGAKS